jgi:hypothetical protein
MIYSKQDDAAHELHPLKCLLLTSEIVEYAQWLGMEIEKDKVLF